MPACGTSVLELIAVLCKHKIARIFLQELFDEGISMCLIEKSSLGVIFRGRPVTKRAISRTGFKPIGPIAPNWAPRPIIQTLVQVD